MSDYLLFLDTMARRYGIPVEEARALYELESSSGRNAGVSPAGAIGQMQLMPATARELGVDPNDPRQNIRGGVQYYAQQRKAFGDPVLAAAAYNAGPKRVRRAGGVPRIPETQAYVQRFRNLIGQPEVTDAPPSDTTPESQGTMPMPDTGALTALTALAGGQTEDPLNSEYLGLLQEMTKLPEEYAAQRKAQFEAGQKRINERYQGPSQATTLAALSQAFLAPRRYKGFGGTMYNVSQALGAIGQQRDQAEQARANAMAELEAAYGNDTLETRSAALKARADLLKARMNAEKTQRRTGFNPISGELMYMDTGEPVTPELPTLTPEQAAEAAKNPANRGRKFRTTTGQVREIF